MIRSLILPVMVQYPRELEKSLVPLRSDSIVCINTEPIHPLLYLGFSFAPIMDGLGYSLSLKHTLLSVPMKHVLLVALKRPQLQDCLTAEAQNELDYFIACAEGKPHR